MAKLIANSATGAKRKRPRRRIGEIAHSTRAQVSTYQVATEEIKSSFRKANWLKMISETQPRTVRMAVAREISEMPLHERSAAEQAFMSGVFHEPCGEYDATPDNPFKP